MPEENENKRKLQLEQFNYKIEQMISTSEEAYRSSYKYKSNYTPSYTLDMIKEIIDTGSIEAKRQLSRAYFSKGGIYKRIIYQYATLLKYNGVLIPNIYNNSISKFQKKYQDAIKYIDKMNIQNNCIEWTVSALVNGCYYGLILSKNKKDDFYCMSLPQSHCRSRFKDSRGLDIIEFNLSYFDTFVDPAIKQKVLRRFPKFISKEYNKASKKNNGFEDNWIFLPTDYTMYFCFLDGIPLFINIIPAIINYEEAVENEKERDLEEIRKILVQKIPHLTTGELLFEPDEAEIIHKGSVKMMNNNKNVSVLTTYADVDAIVSKTSSDAVSDNLEKTRNGIFHESGISKELFSSSSNLTLAYSTKTEIALMMTFANKISFFITQLINTYFGDKNTSFVYKILPISYQNENDYINQTLKMANSGYSFILPALALDISQSQLIGLKDLENDLLKVGEKLLTLSTIQKQIINEDTTQIESIEIEKNPVGAPQKPPEEKSPKTESNEKSKDKVGD